MSLADSLLHPRESTLAKGWRMEESNISNEQALYTKPSTSASTSAVSTPLGSTSSWSFISRTTSNTSFVPSTPASENKPELTRLDSRATDVDSGYGSSPDSTPSSKRNKSKKYFKKRSKSRDTTATSRPSTPTPTIGRSSTSASTGSASMATSPTTSPSRGRSFGFKKLAFRSKSKSRERSPTRAGKSSTSTEDIPPVPSLNLPIAQRFMRSNNSGLSPVMVQVTDLSKDLWNDTPMLPSTRRASRLFFEQVQEAAASARASKASGHESLKESDLQPTGQTIMTTKSPKEFPRRRRNSSADITFSVGSPPITPAGMLQPKSFLSMSSSTVNLLQQQKKLKRKGGVPGNFFFSSLGKSSGNALKEPKSLTTSPTSRPKKASTPTSPKSPRFSKEKNPTTSPTSPQRRKQSSEQHNENRHFSFVEISEEEGIHIPWSWIEVDPPTEAEAGPSAAINPPNVLISADSRYIQYSRRHSQDSEISEYDPFKAVPPGVIYSTDIPTIRRGRQAPFPAKPLLPPDFIPRIRAAHYRDPSRYKDLATQEEESEDLTHLRTTRRPHVVRPEDTELSFYSERARFTGVTAADFGYERDSLLTEGKSKHLRKEFEMAVDRMIENDMHPTFGFAR